MVNAIQPPLPLASCLEPSLDTIFGLCWAMINVTAADKNRKKIISFRS